MKLRIVKYDKRVSGCSQVSVLSEEKYNELIEKEGRLIIQDEWWMDVEALVVDIRGDKPAEIYVLGKGGEIDVRK